MAVTDRSGNLVQRPQAGGLRGLRGGQEAGDRQVRAGAEPAADRRHRCIDTSGSMASSLADRAEGGGAASCETRDEAGGQGVRGQLRRPAAPARCRPPTTSAPWSQAITGLQAVGDTALHDALVHSLYYFRGVKGQRALVLLSDGDDNASYITYKEAHGVRQPQRRRGLRDRPQPRRSSTPAIKSQARASSPRRPAAGPSSPTSPRSCRRSTSRSRPSCAAATCWPTTPPRRRPRPAFRPVEVKVKKSGLKARAARGYYP